MDKLSKTFVFIGAMIVLSGCVTQSYENDNSTPVVQNEANNNEIAMTRISLGLGYLKMGNTVQAKLNLEKAKRFAPNLVQVYTAFAHYYGTVNEPELAINAYQKALSLNPKDADTLNNFGVFLCKQQQFDEAEKQILKAIAVPSYILVAKSYENIALCQLKAKRFVKAELYLKKAIEHNPSSGSSLLHMVQLQYAKSEFIDAEQFLKRYEKATRRFSPTALALAFKVYSKLRNKITAKNYASMLVKMFPNSFETKQYLLNGLSEIEADRLAKEYQAIQLALKPAVKNKKRVVVLSPKTAQSTAINRKVSKQSEPMSVAQAAKIEMDKLKSLQKKANLSVSNKTELPVVVAANNAIPVHVVVKGDSLFSISKKYNIHMKSIEKWNEIQRSGVLKIGDVIYLSDPKEAAKS